MSIISEIEFENLLENFKIPEKSRIAVAVSGGADSLCLALLLKDWALIHNCKLSAFIVDHRLRENSTIEAQKVKKKLKILGIPLKVLSWIEEKPKTGLEEKAREKRYSLLLNSCKEEEIDFLFIGHHLKDLTETFLARLSHKSGIDGLVGINEKINRENIFICRPFLKISKERIIETLKMRKIDWLEDPMNQNLIFERVRLRKFIPTLEKIGINQEDIYKVTQRLKRAKEALDFYADVFIKKNVIIFPQGYLQINTKDFEKLPNEIKIRVLIWAISVIGQARKIISLEVIEKFLMQKKKKITVGECFIFFSKKLIFITKEFSKQPSAIQIKAKTWTAWDRFQIWSEKDALIDNSKEESSKNKKIPALVQASFPRLFTKKGLEIKTNISYNCSSGEKEGFIYFNAFKKGILE